eukprot:45564-Rhodomonas_salina.1
MSSTENAQVLPRRYTVSGTEHAHVTRRGVAVWGNGDQYMGEWEGGLLSGSGIFEWGSSILYAPMACDAVSGTDVSYAATRQRRRVHWVRYLPRRVLRGVRY